MFLSSFRPSASRIPFFTGKRLPHWGGAYRKGCLNSKIARSLIRRFRYRKAGEPLALLRMGEGSGRALPHTFSLKLIKPYPVCSPLL